MAPLKDKKKKWISLILLSIAPCLFQYLLIKGMHETVSVLFHSLLLGILIFMVTSFHLPVIPLAILLNMASLILIILSKYKEIQKSVPHIPKQTIASVLELLVRIYFLSCFQLQARLGKLVTQKLCGFRFFYLCTMYPTEILYNKYWKKPQIYLVMDLYR